MHWESLDVDLSISGLLSSVVAGPEWSVRKAFELLGDHPLLGRNAEDGRRELILSRGRYGYIAKYRWLPAEDIVLILPVRHQLEAG